MSKAIPYVRQTILALTILSEEDSNIAADFEGDNIDAQVRRAALDRAISAMLDSGILNLLKAFELAGVTAAQAAKIIYLTQIFNAGQAGGGDVSN